MSKKSKKGYMPSLGGGMYIGVVMCLGSAAVALGAGFAVKAALRKLQ